jgi:hypothetical protein
VYTHQLTEYIGSAIYYLSAHNFNGAKASISVDGQGSTTVDESAGTQKDETVDPGVVLFSQANLDGTKQHTIQVSWAGVGAFGGGYVEVYGFMSVLDLLS